MIVRVEIAVRSLVSRSEAAADLLELGLKTAGAVLRRNVQQQNSIMRKSVDIGAPSRGRVDVSLFQKVLSEIMKGDDPLISVKGLH